ncbi:Glycoside hydrolase, family 5 domain protein [Candidatus Magnetoovum chiemensis]|nr:Glycoside hydrolase, family 5 domain protein [Candidatus Magnetoovum chiemensis]
MDYQIVRDVGLNTIRLAISRLHIRSSVNDKDAFNNLKYQVDWAKANGLYLIIAYHNIDDSSFWESVEDKTDLYQQYIEDWKKIAKAFAGETHVLFEVMNEPTLIDNDNNNTIYAEFVKESIKAIRDAGAVSQIIVVDGLYYATPEPNYYSFIPDLKNTDSNILYSFHYYRPAAFVFQHCAWQDNNECVDYYDKSSRLSDDNIEQIESELNQMKKDVGQQYNVPLFLGEFGIPELNYQYPGVSEEDYNNQKADSLTYFKTLRDGAENNGFSWSIFTYRDALNVKNIFYSDKQISNWQARQFCFFSGWGVSVEDMLPSEALCSKIKCKYYIRPDIFDIVNIINSPVAPSQPTPTTPETYKVSVNISVSSGHITSTPAGIDCGYFSETNHEECYFDFSIGETVTLTAEPDSDQWGPWEFSGWSGEGGCSGTSRTCTIIIGSDKDENNDKDIVVNATFERE